MAFPVTVDRDLMAVARQWISFGWVTAVAEDTEGAYYIEVDVSKSGRAHAEATVLKAYVSGGVIRVVANPPSMKKAVKATTEIAIAVEILRRVGVISLPASFARVELTREEPEVPNRGLTDRMPTLFKKVSEGTILKPEFPDPAAEYLLDEEEAAEMEVVESGDGDSGFGELEDFDVDPAADEVRAYLLEEGVPLALINKVIAARRNDLTPELQSRVPPLRRFRGNLEVLMLALICFLQGKGVFAVGVKASGKTTLIHSLASCFNLPLYELNGSLQTEVADIRGDKTLDVDPETKANVVRYQLGVLAEAMKNGGLCYIDEFPTIREGVATVINGVGDWRKSLEIPGYGIIQAHPAFRLALAGNKGYAGCLVPNEATIDRMVVLDVQPIRDQVALEKVIAENVRYCKDRTLISKLARLFVRLSEMLQAGEINSAECLTIRGLIDAADMMAMTHGAIPARAVLYSTVANKIWDDEFADVPKIKEQINLVFPA